MKIIGYDTKKPHTTEIVRSILSPVNGQLLTIEDYRANGLPDADLIIISGILRGSGLVYKECVKRKRKFVFVDHAYFLKGYAEPNWMRMTVNRHCFGPSLQHKPGDRFKQNFASKYSLLPWRDNQKGHILVLPPTHAICWLFDAHDWLEKTVSKIRSITDRPIKIRSKPEDPIVDNDGNLIKMQMNDTKDIPLTDDISAAHAVVAYNSNSVIEAIRLGVPVICEENCAAYPISYRYDDLGDSHAFRTEPNRLQLFYDLAHAQFTRREMQQGLALKAMQQI